MSKLFRFVFVLSFVAAALAVPVAHASTSGVVISQVFAGGGNSGAPFANDYVELFNGGTSPVDVGGWTVQYASAASTTWQATPLTGTITPGRYLLVQLASGGTAGAALPAPDVTGTTNLAASGGKLALVRDATALSCGAAAGSCSANALVEDIVGYGSAADYEGSAAGAALTNTTALVRAAGGCTDTDANAADFASGTPAPRNSVQAAAACSAPPPPPPPASSATAVASVDVDVQPVLSIALERSTISFGHVFSGETPPPISEKVTIVSNNAAGYSLSVHRTAFAPADLPLAIAASPTASLVPIPVTPAADLLLASTTAPSAGAGDVWPTGVGFASPLPAVTPNHYTATVTFTVIGR
jgi:lamin tail-like protein